MRAAVIFVVGAACAVGTLFSRNKTNRDFLAAFGGCLMVAAVLSGFAS